MDGDNDAPMDYRSLSFHRARIPNKDLVRRGADVGFNDLTFQTEGSGVRGGGPVEKFELFKRRAKADGYFNLADELDMTITVWTTELDSFKKSSGVISLDNGRLWTELRDRYEYLLHDLLPDIDYIALKVTESQYWMADPPLLTKLIRLVNDVCREADTNLIYRTFMWNPDELDLIAESIRDFPADVIVQNKNWPQDWHQRSVQHPLIGNVGDRKELVEVDLNNEYAYLDNLANCYTDRLNAEFKQWIDKGVSGIAARVARQPQPPCIDTEGRMFDILGHPNEANMWVLGYLTSGRGDIDDAWEDYASGVFDEDVAESISSALRPSGDVVEEGFCVKNLQFGFTKWNGMTPGEEGNIPGHETMLGEINNSIYAQKHSDQAAEKYLKINPFSRRASRWRWDESYVPEYHKIRKGHPDVIEEKTESYQEALEQARTCLDEFSSVEGAIAEEAYTYFRFRLEENLFHLQAKSEMELAWLKASNALYFASDQSQEESMLVEVRGHLNNLRDLIPQYEESVEIDWKDESTTLYRGGNHHRYGAHYSQYIDIPGFIHEFRRYWKLRDYYDVYE